MTDYITDQAAEWDAYTKRYAGHESVSGPGSTFEFTRPLRVWLPKVFARYNIRSILDVACGDWAWMRHVDLNGIIYTGWDINRDVINSNQDRFGYHTFAMVNLLTVEQFPKVDLIIARDILIHLPDEHVVAILNKCRASGSRYLLATNFAGADNDTTHPFDDEGFRYRPTDLQAPPFNMAGRVNQVDEPGRETGREMVLFDLKKADL